MDSGGDWGIHSATTVPIVYVLPLLSMLVIDQLSAWLGGPRDTTYLIIVGALFQAFLIGWAWDFVSAKLGTNKSDGAG